MKTVYTITMHAQLVIACLLSAGIIFASQPPSATKPQRLMIILDKGGTRGDISTATTGVAGPLVRKIADGIEQGIPMLVSTPLLFALMLSEVEPPKDPYNFLLKDTDFNEHLWRLMRTHKRSEESHALWIARGIRARLEDPKQWKIYERTTSQDLALLLPAHATLETFDIDSSENKLMPVPATNFQAHFNDEHYLAKPINIDHIISCLNALFYKNIYLAGHGSSGLSIAGVTIDQYKELLKKFEKVKVKFLYVLSCFSGGLTSLIAHEELSKSSIESSFPVAVSSTEDTAYSSRGSTETGPGSENYLKVFFEQLEKWQRAIGGQAYYFGKTSAGISISDVLRPLYERDNLPENLPSVRMPGKETHFRPIELKDTYNLTFQNLLALKTGQSGAFD